MEENIKTQQELKQELVREIFEVLDIQYDSYSAENLIKLLDEYQAELKVNKAN